MRVLLDVTSTTLTASGLASLCDGLTKEHNEVILTCCVSHTDRVLAWRHWLLACADRFISPKSSVTFIAWHDSGLHIPEVDALLFASFVAPHEPELIVSDLLVQHRRGNALIIDWAQVAASDGNGQTLSRQLMQLANRHRTKTDPADTDSVNTRQLTKATKPNYEDRRLRLAMLSPVAPARSGVADYSAELAMGLRDYYDITLIDTTPHDLRHWDESARDIKNVESLDWFLSNTERFDRVVYQLGNSDYHVGVWSVMEQTPGIAVLHDIFQGGYLAEEQRRNDLKLWPEVLLYEYGFRAQARAQVDRSNAMLQYAGNYRVFRDSLGVVLHSRHAAQLAACQIGAAVSMRLKIIPLVRQSFGTPSSDQKAQARQALGLPVTGIMVCSFGYIAPSKLPLRLLEAWHKSELSANPNAQLIFVGHNLLGHEEQQVTEAIAALPHPDRVSMTGFVDGEVFAQYLRAADFAIQLRAFSRGETSGAALQAMGHGLPQIVNANGSFAEIDERAVWMLPDTFETDDLVLAMNTLYHEPDKRQAMAQCGPDVIAEHHSPAICARAYRDFIESCYAQRHLSHPHGLLREINRVWPDGQISAAQRIALANAIDFNRAASLPRPRLLLDITSTQNTALRTGIERVALALLDALIELEPAEWVVTPAYLDNPEGQWHYFQANNFMVKRLDLEVPRLSDHQLMPRHSDALLTLDLSTAQFKQADEQGLFKHYRASGVRCYSLVYDLLPVTLPDKFPDTTQQIHENWLSVVSKFDGALCISAHVAQELDRWRAQQAEPNHPYRIGSFLLGADTDTFKSAGGTVVPSHSELAGSLDNLDTHVASAKPPPIFLMVGTIEPRKGYLETIHAFLELWAEGFDAHLIIVGREGWTHLEDAKRKDIPATIELLCNHPERFRRLVWLNNADDIALEAAYARAECLIAASYDEGFGLPIIEATRHGVPVLARDIAVFREVAPAGTAFFKDGELANAIANWTKPEQPPKDEHTITWRESAQQVLQWLRESTSKLG